MEKIFEYNTDWNLEQTVKHNTNFDIDTIIYDYLQANELYYLPEDEVYLASIGIDDISVYTRELND